MRVRIVDVASGSLFVVRPGSYIGMATLHPDSGDVIDYLTTVIGRS
jgi:hypothetical protein